MLREVKQLAQGHTVSGRERIPNQVYLMPEPGLSPCSTPLIEPSSSATTWFPRHLVVAASVWGPASNPAVWLKVTVEIKVTLFCFSLIPGCSSWLLSGLGTLLSPQNKPNRTRDSLIIP